jgi:hypothetical protein
MKRRRVIAGLVAMPFAARAQGVQKFERSELEVVTANGRHKFKIELALTPEQMAQGLMFAQWRPMPACSLIIARRSKCRSGCATRIFRSI